MNEESFSNGHADSGGRPPDQGPNGMPGQPDPQTRTTELRGSVDSDIEQLDAIEKELEDIEHTLGRLDDESP